MIVALCFIMDVKVKADVIVEAVRGQAEIEHNHELVKADALAKLPTQLDGGDFDVETFDSGTVRLSVGSNRVGLAQQSILAILKDQTVSFAKGRAFFSMSKKNPLLKIQTPQGLIQGINAEFLVDVIDGKTKVSVLSGSVDLKDRASQKEVQINSGYASWLGGLLPTGQHAKPLRPEACEIQKVMETVKPLMGWSEKEYQGRFDALKNKWKEAVIKVAEDAQDSLNSDIKELNHILRNEHDFEEKRNREQAKLRKLFKEKTTGLPGENSEDESEPSRFPSSDSNPRN
jgi:hypothetical protein